MQSGRKKEKEYYSDSFKAQRVKKTRKFYRIVDSSRKFYADFLRSRCAGKSVLEYGCGLVSYSFFLARNGASVTGIDRSSVAIEQSKEVTEREGLERITYCIMDAEALGFSDSTFDLICGTGILHHIDLDRAFQEIARALKPGGKAVFIEPLGHNPVINLYRKLTPALRMENESPLLMDDFKRAGAHFGRVETHCFNLISVAAVPFRNVPGFDLLLRALDATDRALFRLFPRVKRYAWQVIIVLSKASEEIKDEETV